MKRCLLPDTQKRLLKRVQRAARSREVTLFAVGGAVRDLLSGRRKKEPDFDFSLDGGALVFGRFLARRLRAAYVLLDEEHGACRLVKRIGGELYTLDFTDFRGQTLADDLRMRDFTVNALAVSLDDLLTRRNPQDFIIDPLNGRKDIARGVLRMCGPRSFRDDPLRILRAFSFAALFGWRIAPAAKAALQRQRKGLLEVSGERIRDEFFKVLRAGEASRYVKELDRLKVLAVIFPEIEKMRGVCQGPYHHLDIWKHTLETMKQCDAVLRDAVRKKELRAYLAEDAGGNRPRSSLIKLGCLLHDAGKPRAKRREGGKLKFHGHEHVGRAMAVTIGRRLKLSTDEIDALCRMVRAHLRPGYLSDNVDVITPRAVYRFFRDTGKEAPAVLLLSLADQRATRGRLTTDAARMRHEKLVRKLLREYFRRANEKKAPRLVNGDLLISRFKLRPSPLIGKILSELDELQAIGRVRTRSEALKAVKGIIAHEEVHSG
ncbi:MAG: HD domain-containing protein [Candidatus Omnitrophica bacterium]|nr:HD domain-containing protein [Candidatus Omnitrophota bacterium]